MASTQISITSAELERGLEWERAAKMLDLSPEMVRRIRFPRFECVSHHESPRGKAGTLYIASGPLSSEGTIACLRVGSQVAHSDIAAQWQELQLSAALGDGRSSSAAIGLHLNETASGEAELWQLAQQCVPVIARTLGEVTLLPQDDASAAVAGWMAHTAGQFGFRVRTTFNNPADYCSELIRRRGRTMTGLASLALRDCGKALGRCTVAVIGTGALGCECLENLRQIGSSVIAAADESGSLLDAGGIDPGPLLRHVRAGGLLAEYKEGQHALHADALSAGADLLLLCGGATEITEANCARVRQGTVVIAGEGSNLSAEAGEDLGQREVLALPARLVHSPEIVAEFRNHGDEQFRTRVAELWERIWKLRNQYEITVCDAVMLLAVGHLAEEERSARP